MEIKAQIDVLTSQIEMDSTCPGHKTAKCPEPGAVFSSCRCGAFKLSPSEQVLGNSSAVSQPPFISVEEPQLH